MLPIAFAQVRVEVSTTFPIKNLRYVPASSVHIKGHTSRGSRCESRCGSNKACKESELHDSDLILIQRWVTGKHTVTC